MGTWLVVDGVPVVVMRRRLKRACEPYGRRSTKPVTDVELTATSRVNALFGAHRGEPAPQYPFLLYECRDAGGTAPDQLRRWLVVGYVVHTE